MDIKNVIYAIEPPCKKCPYTKGLVTFVVSPCPHCKLNGYSTYERLVNGTYAPPEIKTKNNAKKTKDKNHGI